MSFGDGNLHEKCDMYRRQLGGTNAALNRSRQRERDIEGLVQSLFRTLCTLFVNGHAPTGRQIDHYEKRIKDIGIEVVDL